MMNNLSRECNDTLKSSFNLLGLFIDDIRDITVNDIENILNGENKSTAETYLKLAHPTGNEKNYIRDLLNTFASHEGKPITNAYLLHELLESKLMKHGGIDIVTSSVPVKLHAQSALFHSFYLYLYAQNNGLNTSYEEVLSYDPIGCKITKEAAQYEFNVSSVSLNINSEIFKYFKNILSKEYGYLVFGESPLGNGDFYESN